VPEKAQNFYRKNKKRNNKRFKCFGPVPFQSFLHKYPKIAAVSPATQIFNWPFLSYGAEKSPVHFHTKEDFKHLAPLSAPMLIYFLHKLAKSFPLKPIFPAPFEISGIIFGELATFIGGCG
jgi:hypothetical protein